MYIDESLANGLKNRFFTEMPERISEMIRRFTVETRGKQSRTAWRNLPEKTKRIFSDCALSVYLGGSNRKPYLGLCCLALGADRPVNDWTERFFASWNVVFNCSPIATFESVGSFVLSEHAIKRLYQRAQAKNQVAGNSINTDFILPELRYLPVWSSYWQSAMTSMHAEVGIEEFFPVLPGISGLFFAECSIDNSSVEVRTFVGDAQLTEEQLYVKNRMLIISQTLQSSPMAIGSLVDTRKLDLILIDRLYLSSQLGSDVSTVSNIVFHPIENDTFRASVKSGFQKWLSTESQVYPGIVDLIDTKGVKSLHMECHPGLLKSKGNG